jgi:hypothetical protein
MLSAPQLALFDRFAQRAATHWLTFASWFIVLVAMSAALLHIRIWLEHFTTPGLTLFNIVMQINYVVVLIAGIVLFSTLVTHEKQPDALGLLIITGATPFSILASIAVSRMLLALSFLALQIPFTLIASMLGGISNAQIFACYGVLGAHLLLMASIGTFASVVFDSAPRAIGGAIFLTLAYNALWFGLDALALLPPQAMLDILSTAYAGETPVWCISAHLIPAIGLLAASIRLFDTTSPTRVATDSTRTGIQWRSPASRAWANALAWKSFYFVSGGRRGLMLRVVGFFIVGIGAIVTIRLGWADLRVSTGDIYSYTGRQVTNGEILLAAGLLLTVVDLTFACSRVYGTEVARKTYINLLALPVAPQRLTRDLLAGMLPALIPSALLCGVALLCDIGLARRIGIPMALGCTMFFIYYLHWVVLFSISSPYSGWMMGVVMAAVTIAVGLKPWTLANDAYGWYWEPTFWIIVSILCVPACSLLRYNISDTARLLDQLYTS